MKTRGKFISLEGTEGVGKSTNLDFIRGHLAAKGVSVAVTREPGGTPLAEDIRELLLRVRDESVDLKTETLLVFAARAQHVSRFIEPTLANGEWVLSDRFTDATLAYQGAGRGIAKSVLTALAEFTHGHLWPDLTLYLDAPVELALGRIRQRDHDRFEREDVGFFERVRDAYIEIAETEDRVVLIDATQALEDVQRDIAAALDAFLVGR